MFKNAIKNRTKCLFCILQNALWSFWRYADQKKSIRKIFEKNLKLFAVTFFFRFFRFFYTIVYLMTCSGFLACVRAFFKKTGLGWVTPFTIWLSFEYFHIGNYRLKANRGFRNGDIFRYLGFCCTIRFEDLKFGCDFLTVLFTKW